MLYDSGDDKQERQAVKKFRKQDKLAKSLTKAWGERKLSPSLHRFYAKINARRWRWLEQTRGARLATIKINISSNAVVNVVDDRSHMEKKSNGKMNQKAEPKQM